MGRLFPDGAHFGHHANARASRCSRRLGLSTEGKPVFVGLDAAVSESSQPAPAG